MSFSDIQIVNPSFDIVPGIEDEKGFSGDLGIRGQIRKVLRFDANVFYLYYGNRIGEYHSKRKYENSGSSSTYAIRKRGNVGVAQIMGIESFAEVDVLKMFQSEASDWTGTLYSNFTVTEARYTRSPHKNIERSKVEYVPNLNWKAGVQGGYKQFRITWQLSHLSEQFSDATNARESGYTAVNGIIPAYTVMDLSLSWSWRWLSIEGSVNNLTDATYFTRRATGYPGPGILPGEGRSFYLTTGVKF